MRQRKAGCESCKHDEKDCKGDFRSRGWTKERRRITIFYRKTTGVPAGGGITIPKSKIELKSSLVVRFSDRKTLRAVSASLEPDNVNFPEGMKFLQKTKEKQLLISIIQESGKDNQFETLISTLDEIVSHIYSATSAIEKAENL